jgi:hypothetical protein
VNVGDKPMWGLLAAFVGWEIFASQIKHDLSSHTLSDDVWRWQEAHPGVRILVGAFLGGLAAHLLILPRNIPNG